MALGMRVWLLGALAGAFVAQAGAAERGGTLVIGNGDEPRVLAANFNANVPDVMVGCMVYDGLVRFAPGFEIVPGLATSWEISPDGLVYTMHLDPAAKWEDGKPLTSEDVAYTLMEISSKYGPKFAAAGAAIAGIDSSDPHTAVIKLKQAFGPFLFSLVCEQNAGIMPKHVFAGTDILKNPALTTQPMGSGAYRLTEWVRGDHLTLSRNPGYRRAGLPYLDRYILKTIPDSSARVLAMQAGEIDMIEELYFPLNFYKQIAADPRFQLKTVGYGADDLVIFNTKHSNVDRAVVRQALMVAIDRDYLFKNVFFGLGPMGRSAIDSRMGWAVNPAVDYNTMYPFDPAKARAMLDEAGLKPGADGTRFTLRLVFGASRAEEVQTAQVLARNWGAVGVKVVLAQTESAVYSAKIFTDYDFDATLANYSTGGDPALGISRLYTTATIKKGSVYVNASQYSNPEADTLFDEARDAPNQAARAAAYFKVQEIIARDLPVLTLHEQVQVDAVGVAVQDMFLAAHYPWWDQVWMKK